MLRFRPHTRTGRARPALASWLRVVTPFAAALFLSAASPVAAQAAAFPDVPAGHPYAAAVAAVSDAGVMTGYADGRFGPSDTLLRQQFAKMIVLALGLPVSTADNSPFTDVHPPPGAAPPGADPLYPDHYVAVAAARGITRGVTSTHFGPWRTINRAQLITMVVRGFEAEFPGGLAAVPGGFIGTWRPTFSPEHGENIRKAQFNGLLAGLPLSTLDPWGPMSRAESAQVLANLLAWVAAEGGDPGGQGGPGGPPPGPVVAFQPSHQDDTGAVDWHEYVICGDIARRTIALLAGSPVRTVLAWETGMGLTGSNNTGSNARAFDSEIRRANEAGADYFISIHNDGAAPSGVLGMFFTGDAGAERLAATLARSISRETGLPYRGTRGRPLYSLDPSRNHAPARVLLEIGDNVKDRAFLESPAGRQRIAAALAAEVSLLAKVE